MRLSCAVQIRDNGYAGGSSPFAFIVRSVLRLYEQGGAVEQGLPALSIYVGHAKVVDTYWYLTGIPELMAVAAERFRRYAQGEPT